MATSSTAQNNGLDDLLRFTVDSPSARPSEANINLLTSALSSSDRSTRAKAYSILAMSFRDKAQSTPWLSDHMRSLLQSTNNLELYQGFRCLSAVFQLSPGFGFEIIGREGFILSMAESVIDLLALGPSSVDLNYAVAEFLALAMNHKDVRKRVQVEWPGSIEWLNRLNAATNSTMSIPARCAATLALIKLRLAAETLEANTNIPTIGRLTSDLITALTSWKNDDSVHLIVEGLALVSQNSGARRNIMDASEVLLTKFKRILSTEDGHMPNALSGDTSAAYGIAITLSHLTAYKPFKTSEDEAADRLRKLARQSTKAAQSKKILEVDEEEEELVIEDEAVFGWIFSSLNRNNDLLDLIGHLVKIESKQVRRTAARLLFNLVERPECRGKVLQGGGGRMLLKIVATLTIPCSTGNRSTTAGGVHDPVPQDKAVLDTEDLPVLQALAKLLITTNPLLIFGPSPESPLLLSTIKPLVALFVHSSATLLQIFESLMALTNLSSLSQRIATEVARSTRLLARLEECIVGIGTGENDMVRRAATELLCNLANDELVLSSFIPPTNTKQIVELDGKGAFSTRLHLLFALSSCEDLPTALAASGALATLAENSSEIAHALLYHKKLFEARARVATDVLEEGKVGVAHRLIVMMGNMTSVLRDKDQLPDLFKPQLLEALRNLSEKLGYEDDQSKEVKGLTGLLLERVETRQKIVGI